MFEIKEEMSFSVVCLRPVGRLDTVHASVFDKTVAEKAGKEAFLVIDFSSCHYLSSSGIRVLLRTDRELASAGGKLILSGLSGEMLQVLQIAGLDHVFKICTDVSDAVTCIRQCEKTAISRMEIFPGKAPCETEIVKDATDAVLYEWTQPRLAGFDSLHIAAGTGALGDTLMRKDAAAGFFFTLYHCTGFIPEDTEYAPDFRIVSDPAQGTVFVDHAFSVRGNPRVRVTVNDSEPVRIIDLIKKKGLFPGLDHVSLCTVLCLDRNPERPSLSVVFKQKNGLWEGGTFLLHQDNEKQPGKVPDQHPRALLSWENIEGIAMCDTEVSLTRPVFWLFFAGQAQDPDGFQTQVIFEGDEILPDYMVYLTRRLYTDSRKAALQRLHGGYSASTYRVRSYDPQGRLLRPTVLKTGDRSMIQREAARCKEYAMPYILNNSAMILGTSYYCSMGALRYNFVGIGGEGTELKWLAHYFNNWPVSELEPLFDKIFLKILKPWYGQPVREVIFPYADHDPTKTFFPHICQMAEKELHIPMEAGSFRFEGSTGAFLNPYKFLKEEYPKRRERGTDYFTSVCHGDLNMQNILLDKDMNVYLIDFSETRPRSVISDFARLEAIFMIESFPMENEEDFLQVLAFLTEFYEAPVSLDKKFRTTWSGRLPGMMHRITALTLKMRQYALASVEGRTTYLPYALALLEWILPVVCYASASIWQKRLSACVASLLCSVVVSDN